MINFSFKYFLFKEKLSIEEHLLGLSQYIAFEHEQFMKLFF